LGIALLATVLSGFTPVGLDAIDPLRALDGFHVTFVVTAGLAAIAAVAAAALIRDEDAAILPPQPNEGGRLSRNAATPSR
jgi:hypothetical protein